MNDYRLYLMHSGVEGQKWGVKNGPPYPLDKTVSTGKKLRSPEERRRMQEKEARKRAHKQAKADRRLKNKYRNTLTDEELDIYINRLSKEKQLNELMNESQDKGRKAVTGVLGKIGQDAAIKLFGTAIAGLGAMAVYSALGGKADPQMWAEQLSGVHQKKDKGKGKDNKN